MCSLLHGLRGDALSVFPLDARRAYALLQREPAGTAAVDPLEAVGVTLGYLFCQHCHFSHAMWRARTEIGLGTKMIAYLNKHGATEAAAFNKRKGRELRTRRARFEAAVAQVVRWPRVALGAYMDKLTTYFNRDDLVFTTEEVIACAACVERAGSFGRRPAGLRACSRTAKR